MGGRQDASAAPCKPADETDGLQGLLKVETDARFAIQTNVLHGSNSKPAPCMSGSESKPTPALHERLVGEEVIAFHEQLHIETDRLHEQLNIDVGRLREMTQIDIDAHHEIRQPNAGLMRGGGRLGVGAILLPAQDWRGQPCCQRRIGGGNPVASAGLAGAIASAGLTGGNPAASAGLTARRVSGENHSVGENQITDRPSARGWQAGGFDARQEPLSSEGVSQMDSIPPGRLLTLVRPGNDLVLRESGKQFHSRCRYRVYNRGSWSLPLTTICTGLAITV